MGKCHQIGKYQYSLFDFYKSSEQKSEKSSFQINNFFSRDILIYDIYEL
jgi:hypothetical protein